jgi:hypothetical protein
VWCVPSSDDPVRDLDNPQRLALLSTIVLMDPATGQTLAVMEGNTITAMRTAAASAVVADALVPRTPQVVAMLGSGVLARSHELVQYARLGAVGREAVETAYWGRGRGVDHAVLQPQRRQPQPDAVVDDRGHVLGAAEHVESVGYGPQWDPMLED